ncbi:hypothetical protein [Sporomusa paucivorans]|uniref:hypothetical protein n=1 Tax=Sporomusa paucivorans TaxID=2376 RepID=UPI0035714A5F
MKSFLFLLIWLLSFPFSVNAAVLDVSNYPDMSKPLQYTNYTDSPAPERGKDWRKLEGHELVDHYIIYFRTGKGFTPGVAINSEFKPLATFEMDEVIKGTFLDGRTTYEKRKDWYNKFRNNFTKNDYHKANFPEIYNEWFCLYSGKDAERILRMYMIKTYMPTHYPGENDYHI